MPKLPNCRSKKTKGMCPHATMPWEMWRKEKNPVNSGRTGKPNSASPFCYASLFKSCRISKKRRKKASYNDVIMPNNSKRSRSFSRAGCGPCTVHICIFWYILENTFIYMDIHYYTYEYIHKPRYSNNIHAYTYTKLQNMYVYVCI